MVRAIPLAATILTLGGVTLVALGCVGLVVVLIWAALEGLSGVR